MTGTLRRHVNKDVEEYKHDNLQLVVTGADSALPDEKPSGVVGDGKAVGLLSETKRR
jgi:hypothetical protein